MTERTEEETQKYLELANNVMNDAVEKAAELLATKPKISELILRQVLKCDPEHIESLQLLGLCKHRMGENAEAIEILQAALEISPNDADNLNVIGLAYGSLGQTKKAIEYIEKAVQFNPSQFLYKNNLALQYKNIGDYESCIKCLKDALANKETPQMWLNLGSVYAELKDVDQSHACYQRAIDIDPEYPAGHVDLSFIEHLKGNWKKGFEEYEWRFWYYPQLKHYLGSYDREKLWNGKDSLDGKRVLIYGEQGAGDIIMFSRYCKDLKDRGAYVIINGPPTLVDILERIDGVDEVCTKDVHMQDGPPFPEYDYQFSLISAPYLLKPTEICGKPYIKPATEAFRDMVKIEYGDNFNIGIVWAGSPAHPHDQKRSIPLKHFRGLYNTPGVKLFSLQLETRPRQYGSTIRNMDEDTKVNSDCSEKFIAQQGVVDYCADAEDIKAVDLTKMIQSFDDTATILAGLDLLICCDTSVAHLAGAMGMPTWILLPYNCDWRWQIEGDTTAWYDSVRLFRQEQRDNWPQVFKKVEEELNALILQNKR